MTREETVKIIRIMVDSYPNYKPNDISETVDVWHMMLSDYDYKLVAMALKSYILSDTSGFAPSIGQLVAKIQTITKPQELSETEAWSLVSKAIRNSGYNSVEEFAKLPPIVQNAVGLPDQLRTWALDENYNEQVVSSNFMRCYRTELARHDELSKMPEEIKALIDNSFRNSYSAQIEDKRQKTINSITNNNKLKIEALDNEINYVPMPTNIKNRLEKLKKEYNEKTAKES